MSRNSYAPKAGARKQLIPGEHVMVCVMSMPPSPAVVKNLHGHRSEDGDPLYQVQVSYENGLAVLSVYWYGWLVPEGDPGPETIARSVQNLRNILERLQ